MKNFLLGGIFVVGVSFLGCYMYELGRTEQTFKLWGKNI